MEFKTEVLRNVLFTFMLVSYAVENHFNKSLNLMSLKMSWYNYIQYMIFYVLYFLEFDNNK